MIHASVRLRGGAASQIDTIIVLINRGSTTCMIEGYPRIAATGQQAHGPTHVLPIHVTDGSTYFGADPGASPVTLAPGAAASSTVETFLAYIGATAWTTALTVTPPGTASSGASAPYRIEVTRPAGEPYLFVVTAFVAGSNGPRN